MAETIISQNVSEIRELLTPDDLLHRKEFPDPERIHPEDHPDFASLLRDREKIRTLQLLSVKTRKDRIRYHNQPSNDVRETIEEYLKDADFSLQPNAYPDNLPADVEQHILWIRNPHASQEAIANALTKSLQERELTTNEVILFERPRQAKTPVVKASHPAKRHIHVWTKRKKTNE